MYMFEGLGRPSPVILRPTAGRMSQRLSFRRLGMLMLMIFDYLASTALDIIMHLHAIKTASLLSRKERQITFKCNQLDE